MSRSDTIKQKIERNVKYLFKISEPLAHLFNKHKMIFFNIEGLCHLPISHIDPVYELNFDKEIESMREVIDDYQYKQVHRKLLLNYYHCVVDTNKMIKKRYRGKVS